MRRGYLLIGLMVLGIFAAACNSGERSEPVAAADAAVSVTFDDGSCSWEGSALIEQGTVDISLTNVADVNFNFAGMVFAWWISPGEPVNRSQLFPAGLYLFDCLTGGPFDHLWRAAQIEVVLP